MSALRGHQSVVNETDGQNGEIKLLICFNLVKPVVIFGLRLKCCTMHLQGCIRYCSLIIESLRTGKDDET